MIRTFRTLLVALVLVAPSLAAEEAVAGFGDARDPANLARMIDDARDRFQLIDVRTPAEYEAGHIPTAINIDHRQVSQRMADGDRSLPVVVYCRSGNRSGRAARDLVRLGYTVVDFGGINRWDGPVERGG